MDIPNRRLPYVRKIVEKKKTGPGWDLKFDCGHTQWNSGGYASATKAVCVQCEMKAQKNP